jgi:hypothetical protein
MRKVSLLFAVFAAITGLAIAQDEAQLQPLMKAMGGPVGAIRNAADSAAARADAEKLADNFAKVGAFFKAKGMNDAVEFAKTGEDAAKAIAGGADKAANLPKIQGTCMGCHTAHREGAPGSFKIK